MQHSLPDAEAPLSAVVVRTTLSSYDDDLEVERLSYAIAPEGAMIVINLTYEEENEDGTPIFGL